MWVRLLTACEHRQYCNIVKHTHKCSYKRISLAIIILGEIVQDKIKLLMESRKGCIIHDGMSRNGTHFMAVYASYIANEGTDDEHLEINLLSW